MAMALPARMQRHADDAGQAQPRDNAGESSGGPEPSTIAASGLPVSQPDSAVADAPAPPREDPLGHIPRGSRLDLASGVWIEPEEND
jgi:hypothetical protein